MDTVSATTKIAVLKERAHGEHRVAATPETVKKFIALGAAVAVESGAGLSASIADDDYRAVGAEIRAESPAHGADIVLGIQGPDAGLLTGANPGAWVVASLDPFMQRERVAAYAAAGYEALAMEFMPRITRAQSMDILSSQSNLSGYKAVIVSADLYGLGMLLYVISTGSQPNCFPALESDLLEGRQTPQFMLLNRVILKACRPELGDRYTSATELRMALLEIEAQGKRSG